MQFHFVSSTEEKNRMEKTTTLVCVIALALIHIAYGNSDGESGSFSTTEPAATSAGTETEPTETVGGSSSSPTSEDKSNEDCFCTYEYEDENVETLIEQKALKVGDPIRRGELVSFKCKSTDMALTWQNGLRLRDDVKMICNTCKKWQRNDVPICKEIEKNEALISFRGHSHIFPGGIAVVERGRENSFHCYNSWYSPEWDYGQRKAVNFTSGLIRDLHISLLTIKEEESEPSGKYECYVKDDSGQRLGSTFLHLQVKEIYCNVPANPPNGQVTYSSLKYGTELSYKCNVGYLLKEHDPRICSENGIWSNEEPECIETCSIPNVDNGGIGKTIFTHRRKVFKKMNLGEIVEDSEELGIRCFDGFEVADSGIQETEIICGKGKWSPEPICNPASCRGQPPPSKNSQPVISSREHGFTIWYNCTGTYTVKIPGNVKCHFGSWIGIPPRCLDQPCYTRDLNYPGLAKPQEEYFDSFESFEINCETGYRKRTRNQTISCVRGRWGISRNPCIPDRCYLTDLKNKDHVSTRSETFTFSGDRIKIICKEGYSPKSKRMPLCLNGVWQSDYGPICEESGCEIPKIARGSVKAEGFEWEWYWSSLSWEKTIHYEVIPPGSTVASGTVLWFFCDEPYSVNGNGRLSTQTRCVRGRWSTELQCLLGDCEIPKIARGTVKAEGFEWEWYWSSLSWEKIIHYEVIPPGSAVSSGTVLWFYCDEPYSVNGNGELSVQTRCLRGRLATELQCLRVSCRGQPPPSKNARPVIESRAHGFMIWYKCSSSTKKLPGNVTCHFGTWIGIPPRCLNHPCYTTDLHYPGLAKPQEKYFDSYESFQINCERGYRKAGRIQTITCVRGRWGISQNPCIPDILCPSIDTSGIFTLRYSNHRRINSSVTFYCKEDGKRVEGHNYLTCLPNGTWSGPIPKCVDYRSCPEFTLRPGLDVTYSKDLSVGSVASFECSLPTKDLNGSSSSVCQENGSWSNPLPFCEDQKCSIHDLVVSVPEEVEPDMSKVTEEYALLDFEINLKCAKGYVKIGDSKALCQKQGKWKLGSFQCVPGCVLHLDPSSHLLVEPKKESYRIGERITMSCPPGEELSSDVELVMCLSGTWSDSLPNCIEVGKKSGN